MMKVALKILAAIALFAALGWFNFAMKSSQNAVAEAEKNPEAIAQTKDMNLTQVNPSEFEPYTVTDFTNSEAERDRWRNIDDTVMGGISQGTISFTEQNTAIFSGTLSLENNGGFSSVRRNVRDIDLSQATGLSLRVKGDGRRYQLRVQTADADNISYRAEFETTAGEWQQVQFPFSAFEPVFRGRIVSDAPTLNPTAIERVGFLIADKKEGEFQLEIDWIQASPER